MLVILNPRPQYYSLRWQPQRSRVKATVELLRASKTIHAEATPLFYGETLFEVDEATPDEIDFFLDTIGDTNASYIRRVMIQFPIFDYDGWHEVFIQEKSLRIISSIESRCVNLRSLETDIASTTYMENKCFVHFNDEDAAQGVAMVYTRFCAIPSQPDIVLQMCEDVPVGYVREMIKSHDWSLAIC